MLINSDNTPIKDTCTIRAVSSKRRFDFLKGQFSTLYDYFAFVKSISSARDPVSEPLQVHESIDAHSLDRLDYAPMSCTYRLVSFRRHRWNPSQHSPGPHDCMCIFPVGGGLEIRLAYVYLFWHMKSK